MPKDVHPQIQAIIDIMAALGVPKIQDMTVHAARSLVDQTALKRLETYPAPAVAQVTNTSTGAGYGHVPLRIFHPTAAQNTPAIVFFHGGGHVLGSLDSYDTVTRFLANTTGATVISVDYRMAPESPFPAAVDDCFDATRWALTNAAALNIDPAKITVCGDSAGGNLAAVVALMARDAEIPLAAQILIYPVVDYRGGTPSYEKYGEGYGVLETAGVKWLMDRYLPDAAQHDDWRATPKNATSHKGLAPALFIIAECDILRDEGTAYEAQLKSAGVSTKIIQYAGMTHGFFSYLGLVDDAENAHRAVADSLKETLA
ncbi:MAG: alpha/beta hydrolase [Amylibacter sp.]